MNIVRKQLPIEKLAAGIKTMLAFVTTDIAISKELLQEALSEDVKDTYNMISVDGDTSTNDTVLLLANGMAGNREITEKNEDYKTFRQALDNMNETLAKMIAGDGEGCTALFEVKVIGAESKEQAVTLSKSIITSNLTKAAIFGHDVNWGRILCAMGDEELKKHVIQDVVLLKLVGFKLIIVHGGGKEISKLVHKAGMEPQFINGLRVTDEPTMEIAKMVLNRVNKSLVQMVNELGIHAVGISGKDGMMLKCRKKYSQNEDLGFVGEVTHVNPKLIYDLLEKDFLPIICPIGYDDHYISYMSMQMMQPVQLPQQ